MPDINKAYSWAVNTCNAPNVGYSQDYRDASVVGGVTYYDCSSFIYYALKAGGLNPTSVTGSTWPWVTYTSDGYNDIYHNITRLGFKQVPITGKWLPGDVVLSTSHTEMVYKTGSSDGRGYTMGAHGRVGRELADQVSINTYESDSSRYSWLYRYGDGASGDVTDTGYGWTLEAFCALLGNVAQESEYNPGQIEGGYTIESGAGIGLFQWTPDGRRYSTLGNPLINQANNHGASGWLDANFQCEMINNADSADYGVPEEWGWITQYSAVASMAEFRVGTNIEQLTEAWMRNVERPYIPTANLSGRIAHAKEWYEKLKSVDPTEGLQYSWHIVETTSYGALSEQEIYENVLIMYNIFCGLGSGGAGRKRTGIPIWMMIRYH